MHSSLDKSGPVVSIPLVGLVGGVGSGKSSLAKGVAQRMKVAILDADRAGHDALQRLDVKVALRQAFGETIFDQSQEIVRSKLAALVFGSEEQAQRNRDTLQRIVHPIIRADIQQQLQHVREMNQVQAVLLDAPILLESGWKDFCDAVVFIDTPLKRRQKWTQASRGWSAEELTRREASQWPIARKRDVADFVIDNTGSLESAIDQLERIVRKLPASGQVSH